MMAEGRSDDELEQLDIGLGMVTNPEEEALAELRKHQQAAGITFEDPDAPVAGTGGEDLGWMGE